MKHFFSTLVLVNALAFSLTAAAERIVLQMGGMALNHGSKIFLKQEMLKAGYSPEAYRLLNVSVVATGKGQLALLMNNQEVDQKGLIQDGAQINPGVYRVTLNAAWGPQFQNGPWQIQSGPMAQMNVRRVILEINPTGPGGRIFNHQVTLQSFGGFINQTWNAPEGQRIVSMTLVNELSDNKCHRDGARNYGFTKSQAYVNNKCRAVFAIQTRLSPF